MANRTHRITAAAVLGIALVTAHQAAAREQPVTLTVRVYAASTEITSKELAEAEAQVAEVYQAVGVNLHWVHDGREAVDPGSYAVRLVLLSGATARRVIAEEHVDEGVLGQAAAITRSAYIFCNRVSSAAGLKAASFVSVLGYAIAHELGHLVLPPNSHSPTGIMRAGMYPRTARPAYFTATQGTVIRDFLTTASRPDEIKVAGLAQR